MTVVVVDYGMGNTGSVLNMLRAIGGIARLSSLPADIESADKIILPGVGNFGAGMTNLKSRALIDPLVRKARSGTPILGICLGMQLLTEHSEEGNVDGLGLLPGRTVAFNRERFEERLAVPHMGWNEVEIVAENMLVENLDRNPRFYFVHAFHVACDRDKIFLSATYGYTFPAGIHAGNVAGVQFHPEKSHRFGKQLLSNFVTGY